ncbi:Uncharacterised protein [Mycobacteroides abscessus subsp. abscessus]|uniref:hypothetical protein n=1 Tax=Mycobacteroides abscessus TaxID=36809 RepID=UPI000929B5CC|nr:hypothetical protein [Mycobacteroides abscessus]SHS43888.1 Uncharacterised protein [Mycobacteroides abscessus subsp. abscessus]SHS88549.1 Uncharacterised protein [Mycobacteroides abscessus subsp. abscessus]SHS91211.1 Uncharacterised protein [Mycobacteroides abscessus subsp. abscessus]SHU35946.1 Uncharacterised protein [Mycobacteroides abscessus subsp. abscessus]SHU47787.1 Uncharacterised protein [Mycobacteroides abscessus subsp. abscessus]
MASATGRIALMPLWLGAIALSLAIPAFAAAAPALPVGGESPSQTISDLEDQGYDVQINYVMGNSNTPLDMCRVLAVHNPNRSGKPVDSFTTVYVDISCPDFWQDD